MKNKNNNVPATSKLNLLRQICNFIPDFLVPKLARESRGAGGGGWPGSGDDLSDQQPGMERRERRRVVPLPLADRSVLQADQASVAVGRLSENERQRGSMASMGGAVELLALALLGISLRVEP